ncbi:O-antigen biosynthesis glycosyltransferase WbnK-like [Bradysia coprophila]|uniref:O-antigen biosynthesis glycosyltransferase WbnK-like n=1 Tax=Bradysia coprophila TaxID=38358 RepID=UPI00187DAED5|nr:O-antigen biosynthesis glycosyltransferase WbnK-like [Bradysia coprophila]
MSVKILRLHQRYFAAVLITTTIILVYAYLPPDPEPPDLSRGILAPKSKPVIVQPGGGIGNQLFQFAAAYSLAKRRNSDLYICVPSNWESSMDSEFLLKFYATDRSYLLSAFNILYQQTVIGTETGCKEMADLAGVNATEKWYVNERTILDIGNIPKDQVVHVDGCLESEIFFKPFESEVIRQFSLKNHVREMVDQSIKDFASIILSTDSVAIHIRRGDFIWENRLIPISYYEAAIKRMKIEMAKIGATTDITFFVFSDDIDAVKTDFRNMTENFVFVSNKGLSRVADFVLMTMCKHLIVANSTFSWWAAYLNGNEKKIIIAPLPKFPKDFYESQCFDEFYMQIYGGNLTYPDKWITVDPFNN